MFTEADWRGTQVTDMSYTFQTGGDMEIRETGWTVMFLVLCNVPLKQVSFPMENSLQFSTVKF